MGRGGVCCVLKYWVRFPLLTGFSIVVFVIIVFAFLGGFEFFLLLERLGLSI